MRRTQGRGSRAVRSPASSLYGSNARPGNSRARARANAQKRGGELRLASTASCVFPHGTPRQFGSTSPISRESGATIGLESKSAAVRPNAAGYAPLPRQLAGSGGVLAGGVLGLGLWFSGGLLFLPKEKRHARSPEKSMLVNDKRQRFPMITSKKAARALRATACWHASHGLRPSCTGR